MENSTSYVFVSPSDEAIYPRKLPQPTWLVFVSHEHHVSNRGWDCTRLASMITVCVPKFQEVLLPPSFPELVEQNIEVPQAPGQLWLSQCEFLIYILPRESIWNVQNLSPTQEVRWCDRLIQILSRQVGEGQGVNKSLDLHKQGV